MSFVLPGVVKIPAKNSFDEGAMLEPVNTVLKAIRRLNLLRGDFAWVAGQDSIGLMFTKLLSLRGVNVIATDLLRGRLKLARRFGARKIFLAEEASLAEQIHRVTRWRGLDAAIVAVPSDEVVGQAMESVRGAGQILLFAHSRPKCGATVDLSSICVAEKDLVGSYSADFTLQQEVARVVFSRCLDVRRLVTDRFPLGQTEHVIKECVHPGENSLKVVAYNKNG